MSEEIKGLCPTCVNSIVCPTWGEIKCTELKQRIYGYKTMSECAGYKKRDKNFKESRCQCEDCLNNDLLVGEDMEESV